MKYDQWRKHVKDFSDWDHANTERSKQYAEDQIHLNDISQIVTRQGETEIEKSVEQIQRTHDDELESIQEERRRIEETRETLRDGITGDMNVLNQTIRQLQHLQDKSTYGKHFLRIQLRCSKISLQLFQLLTELNNKESSETETGILHLQKGYSLIHEKVNLMRELELQTDSIEQDDPRKGPTMPLEERRRRGENYVNNIIDAYKDNLLDQGAVPGEALTRVISELKAHYSTELEKHLARQPNELFTDPNYEQLMEKVKAEEHSESTQQISATNSMENKKLSPERDNLFIRGKSPISRSLLSMFPPRRAEIIDSSYMQASPDAIRVINMYIGSLKGITMTRPAKNGKWEACHYNPATHTIAMDERITVDNQYLMTQHEYADIFKHEIGHFIDHMLGNASSKPTFLEAMREDTDQFNGKSREQGMRLNDMLDDLFSTGACYDRNVTDILSGLFYNDRRVSDRFYREGIAFFQHKDEYWRAKDCFGNDLNLRGKEVFANGFAIETDGFRTSKDFIERWFPRINEQIKQSIS